MGVDTKKKNTRFPGRPDYTGPTEGWFGLLHHEKLFEWSHDVNERIAYVRAEKPESEIATRLHNMIWIPASVVPADCRQARTLANKAQDDYRKVRANLCWMEGNITNSYRAAVRDHNAAAGHSIEAWIDYNRARGRAAPVVSAYIQKWMPDTAWNGREIVFPS